MPSKRRLLVANRGEIAVRILSTARELNLQTIAIYAPNDSSHTDHAHEAIRLPSSASFLDIAFLVSLCQKHHIDLVHPGYGFLSESASFARALGAAGITFVGPSPSILEQTGNKLRARQLAVSCGVPVLPALEGLTDDVAAVGAFAEDVGWPVMLKAVDGGGGRGIRLVREEAELKAAFRGATAESESGRVFVEKAAVGGWKHVEVQVLGDGTGCVRHFGERECSVQRRYQKVVEVAPSMIDDRALIAKIIESALRLAQRIQYKSLGTWEFLVHPESSIFYFMEINPRLQVEHTITETIYGTDLVRHQLQIALGGTFSSLAILIPSPTAPPPPSRAIQLRLTAEDARHRFSLSVGRINGVALPGGNGVRIDTHIRPGVIVSADFDSLLAKIVVSSNDWDALVNKSIRALDDVKVEGIKTNTELLRGIVSSLDFRQGKCDTQWLEENLESVLDSGSRIRADLADNSASYDTASHSPIEAAAAYSTLIKKGDAFDIHLAGSRLTQSFEETMIVTKLLRSDFPRMLAAEISSTSSHNPFTIHISQSSGTKTSAGRRQGDPKDPSHLLCPFTGQLVEVLVDEGDLIKEWEPVAIIRQMKMELEVRAHRHGVIKSLWEAEEGDEIGIGTLLCEIVPTEEGRLKEKL